jgi:hypothetical protein
MKFISNIKRLIKWIPIIWRDRDWDSQYLLKVLDFKIEMMYNYINEFGIHKYKHRELKQMFRTRLILKRLMDDEYAEWQWKKLHETYGEWIIQEDGVRLEYETEDNKDQIRVIMDKNRLDSTYLRKQDLEFLGKYLAKYIDGWWD